MAAEAVIRCEVRYHRGIEQQDTVPEDDDPYDTLLLRMSITLAQSGEDAADELQLHGRWAAMFQTAGPGDMLQLEGVEELSDDQRNGRCFSVSGDAAAVTIYRDGFHYRVDKKTMEKLDLPEWLRIPPSRKVDGVYRYHRWLCTLRDGADANLWAVVWENSKPGPSVKDGWTRQNFMVVDTSFDSMKCADWSLSQEFPLYTIAVSLKGNALEALPFLSVGDVVRVHRARISSKPPRYINIRQQSMSSVMTFPCPATSVDTQAHGPMQSRAISGPIGGEKHTVVEADFARARSLQAWIQRRLKHETMSAYLVTARELLDTGGHRDLVVQVLEVDARMRRLLVSDGSTDSLRVDASQPQASAAWLFPQIRARMWVRLQGASRADDGDGTGHVHLVVPAAAVTRVPEWCMDVETRRKQMEQRAAETEKPPEVEAELPWSPVSPPAAAPVATAAAAPALEEAPMEVSMPSASVLPAVGSTASTAVPTATAAPLPQLLPASASPRNTKARGRTSTASAEAPRESRGSGDTTELDEEEETPPEKRSESAPAAVESRSEEPQEPEHLASKLNTVYINHAEPRRLRDIEAAARRGERCLVLSNFAVRRICGVSGADATRVEDLLVVRCQACGHVYPAEVIGSNVQAAKRARKALNCGHWIFRIEFRFKLALQEDDSPFFEVFVAGEATDLFGARAEEVLSDPDARVEPQKLLDALRQDFRKSQADAGHSLAVYRHDGPSTAVSGVYAVCDTTLTLT